MDVKCLKLMFVLLLATSMVGLLYNTLSYNSIILSTKLVVRGVKENSTMLYKTVSEIASSPKIESKNKWKLFVGDHSMGNSLTNIQKKKMFELELNETEKDAQKKYLTSIDSDFRLNIFRSVPIHCYSGEYGLFPKKYRNFIDLLIEYSHFHNTQPTKRILVWQCSRTKNCGGFSDRLRGITLSLALAMFTGRKLFISWERDSAARYFEPNVINWNSQDIMNKIKNNFTILKAYSTARSHVDTKKFANIGIHEWQTYLSKIHSDAPYIVINTNLEIYLLALEHSTNGQKWLKEAIIQAGFNNQSYYDIDKVVGFVFRYLFKVDPMVIEETENAMRELKINNTPFLGLHLRTGILENYSHHKLITDTSVWMKAFECAVYQADKYIGNNSLIFLATDSNIAKEMAIAKFGLRFRSLDMEIVHMDLSNPKTFKNGILNLLVDVFILAQSYIQIRGQSGFSFVAESICNIPAKRAYHGEDYCGS